MRKGANNVLWFRSLTFKLFLLVSLILFGAIGTVSWQHGLVFREILNRQNIENLQSGNQMTASSFYERALFWFSLGNSIAHFGARASEQSFLEMTVDAILASNRGVAAVHVFQTQPLAKELLFRATSNASPELAGRKIADLVSVLPSLSQKIVLEELKNSKETLFLRNVFDSSQFPVVLLGTKIDVVTAAPVSAEAGKAAQSVSGTKQFGVVMAVWGSSLSSGLASSEFLTDSIVDKKGAVVLHGSQEKNFSLFSKVTPQNLDPVVKGTVAYNTWTVADPKTGPILSSATKVGNLDIFAVSQKKTGAEQKEIARQIRQILLWAWILFLIGIAISYISAENVTRRLGELVGLTQQIAAGNFSVRLNAVSQDEVGELSRSVNKMAEDVQGLLEIRERAARQESELRMAERIQQLLTPQTKVERGLVKSAAYFKPANECAGDWWGRFSLGNGLELIGIGDATGHGVQSALIAALVHSYFATVERLLQQGHAIDCSPSNLIRGLNNVMYETGKGEATLTMCLLLFDTKAKKLRWSSAGHCFPMTWTSSSSKILVKTGSSIGLDKDGVFEEATESISPGQRFLIYTDGLIECQNAQGTVIKKKVLKNVLGERKEPNIFEASQFLFSQVDSFFGSVALTDDITMVMMEFSEDEPNTVTTELPAVAQGGRQ